MDSLHQHEHEIHPHSDSLYQTNNANTDTSSKESIVIPDLQSVADIEEWLINLLCHIDTYEGTSHINRDISMYTQGVNTETSRILLQQYIQPTLHSILPMIDP